MWRFRAVRPLVCVGAVHGLLGVVSREYLEVWIFFGVKDSRAGWSGLVCMVISRF